MGNVTFTWGNLPAGFCWTDAQTFMDTIFALLQGTADSDQIIISSTLPDPEDQGKIWFRLNVDGTLEGAYKYQGEWHRPHPVPLSSASRMIWVGSEADLWAYDGGDGTDPSSSPPTDMTGAMWEVDTNFEFRMPLGVGNNDLGTSPVDYGGGATTVATGGTGGAEKVQLTTDELAAHQHLMFSNESVSSPGDPLNNTSVAYKADSTPSGTDYEYRAQRGTVDGQIGLTAENETAEDAHQNMPPYIGVAFAKRTARKFYVVT